MNPEDEVILKSVRGEVNEMMKLFPLYS
jgi:hypothetical protein